MKKQLFIALSMLSVFGTYVSEMPAAAAAEVEKCPICMDQDVSGQVHFQCAHRLCEGCFGTLHGMHWARTICPICRIPLIEGHELPAAARRMRPQGAAAVVQGGAAAVDAELERVLRLSQQTANQDLERLRAQETQVAQLEAVMAESARLEAARLEQVQRAEQQEIARALRESERSELARLEARDADAFEEEEIARALEESARLEEEGRAEDELLLQAVLLSLELGAPVEGPRLGAAAAAQPAAAVQPMTGWAMLQHMQQNRMAQQREAFERLERERQRK